LVIIDIMEKNPVLVYDGDCAFCKIWINYWKILTSDKIDYAPHPEAVKKFPGIPLRQFRESVILILPSGEVYKGAEAVFRSLSISQHKRWLLWLYSYLPGFSLISELSYSLIARNRRFFHYITLWFWGAEIKPATYFLVRWIFFRSLGAIYLIAFISFGLQITGLIGSNGILPATEYLQLIQERFGLQGYWLVPTIFWLGTSDIFLKGIVIAGAFFASLLVLGILQRTSLVALFASYLSLVSVGQVFMSFQWDVLLLEVGFLAILLSKTSH